LLLFATLTPVTQEPWFKASQLAPHFQWIATWIRQKLPEHIQEHLQPYTANADTTTPPPVPTAPKTNTPPAADPDNPPDKVSLTPNPAAVPPTAGPAPSVNNMNSADAA